MKNSNTVGCEGEQNRGGVNITEDPGTLTRRGLGEDSCPRSF